MKGQKKKKWIRPRHSLLRHLLILFIRPYCCLKYSIRIKRFRKQGKRPYLILFNHQTAFDQFFVGLSFSRPVYFLATEDIFSMGKLSSLIRYLVAPIPIKKQTTDLKAILTCIRVAKEGGTIAIAPEGNRTYSGRTEYMNPAIAALARKLGMPIALYRLEGGWGVHPRWSDVVRKGKMCGYVSRVIEPEEYRSMTDEELFGEIERGLYVNEVNAENVYRHKKSAEYLERAAYICPDCGITHFESHGDIIECQSCHKQIRYTETTELEGVGFQFPFRFFNDWYEYQNEYVREMDIAPYRTTPVCTDEAEIFKVIPYVRKQPFAKTTSLTLYADRIILHLTDAPLVLGFDEVSALTVLRKNKLNVYIGEDIYQFKGSPRFNAIKYVHLFNRYKNECKGDPHGKFLGL